jgi:hypothetical protein
VTAMLNTMRQAGQVTIMLVDNDPDFPAGYVDREQNTVWVRSDLSDQDLVDVVAQGVRKMLRPALADVNGNAPRVAPSEDLVTPRPQLRLVSGGADQ